MTRGKRSFLVLYRLHGPTGGPMALALSIEQAETGGNATTGGQDEQTEACESGGPCLGHPADGPAARLRKHRAEDDRRWAGRRRGGWSPGGGAGWQRRGDCCGDHLGGPDWWDDR